MKMKKSCKIKNRVLGKWKNFSMTSLSGVVLMLWTAFPVSASLYYQDTEQKPVTLKGFVQEVNKNPLPGVTVRLSGTAVGTTTDTKGWFRMTLPQDKGRLEFSFVGYKTQTVAFTSQTEKDTLYIRMEEQVQSLEEVVVTGFQEIAKKAMTGSYATVKAEDLIMTGNETLESMLQGNLPGLVVTNQSGLTGTRQKLRVRGTTTLNGTAEPLWVVDGIMQEDPLPVEGISNEMNAAAGDLDIMKDFIGSAVSWLNPNDIESITVLKDAVATALYGVRAANGVIVITTKRGGKDGSMAVRYDGGLTLSTRMNYRRQHVMNSLERVDLSREGWERGANVQRENFGFNNLAYAYYVDRTIGWEDFNREVKRMESANTNWFDILYQTPFSHTHNLSFSGRADRIGYYASVGYTERQNTAKGNWQKSFNGNLRMDMSLWDKLQIQASLAGTRTETSAFANNVDPFSYATTTSRALPCYDEESEDGLYYYNNQRIYIEQLHPLGDYNDDIYRYNILHELANSGNKNVMNTLNISLNGRWSPVNSFTLAVTAGGSTSNTSARTWFTEDSYEITTIRGIPVEDRDLMDKNNSRLPMGGVLTTNNTRLYAWTLRVQPEFHKTFNGLHNVSLMAGVDLRSSSGAGETFSRYGYLPERGEIFVTVPPVYGDGNQNGTYASGSASLSKSMDNSIGFYASASYMYDSRYSANVSVRGDGNNTFGREANFLPVWAFGLRWNVTEEAWMQNQNIVNNLGLIVNAGYQGSVVSNVSRKLTAKMDIDKNKYIYTMKIVELPKPDLKWQKTFNVNLGVNFSLFNNKINGNYSWYYRRTEDLVSQMPIPYEYGTANMYLNQGNMTNRGWDMSLTFVPVKMKDFSWTLSTTFSGNNNKIKSNQTPKGDWKEAVSGNMHKKGYPVGAFWAFRYTGLNQENGAPMFDLARSGSDDAAGDCTEYMVYMGTKEPKLTLGINTVLRYKRFSFPLQFYISRGNYEFLASPFPNPIKMPSEYENVSSDLNRRWRKPGDQTDIPSIPAGENSNPYVLYWGASNGQSSTLYPLEAWQYSSARVVKAWFIRFQDFRFSYDLPEKWIKGFAQNLRISATASNPLIIKSRDFKGRDPEVALGQQPRSQNYSINVSVTF